MSKGGMVPSGIEPLPTASEAIVLSVGLRDLSLVAPCGAGRSLTAAAGAWQGEVKPHGLEMFLRSLVTRGS